MIELLVVIFFLTLIDQLSKFIIDKKMKVGQSISIIKKRLFFTYLRNSGAALGKFDKQYGFLYLVSVIALGAFTYLLFTEAFVLSYVFLIAGTLGNFIDRLFRKEVIDFIDIRVFNRNWPIFNVADFLLLLGTIILSIEILFFSK